MILSILNELAATSSTLEKEAILRRNQSNTLLREVFYLTYNPFINFYQTSINVSAVKNPTCTLQEAMFSLKSLSSREVTGHAAKEFLANIANKLSVDDAEVLSRIIGRDLRVGCGASTANKVWPGLIPTFDVMLCDKDITKIKFPAYSQLKSDGARVHIYFDGATITATSRSGKEFKLLGALDSDAIKFMKPGEVFDGELLVVENGLIVPRQIGNGILNKANKGTISQAEADKIVVVVWDIVDFTSTIPYSTRFNELLSRNLSGKFAVVPSIIVNNQEEAFADFALKIKMGEEGTILKNIDHVWVPKRSKDLCKLKEINTADLKIVDLVEGTGKYENMLGAIVCESADGKVKVSVGSGFSDEERKEYWNKSIIGQIVEVMYNKKLKGRTASEYSLFLPRFSFIRFDKTVANTESEIV